MLNGIAPIIIFNFRKNIPILTTIARKIPKTEKQPSFPLPLIPLYLSEELTGLYIDTESKNIDIQTETNAQTDGGDPLITQQAIANTLKVDLVGKRGSIGLMLFGAMADMIFPKVVSAEYSVTYLNREIVALNCLLGNVGINPRSGTDLFDISFELHKTSNLFASKPDLEVKKRFVGPLPPSRS